MAGIRYNASQYGESIGDQQLTVAAVAVACTRPAGAVAAMLTNGAEAVGHYLNPYSVMDLYENDIDDVKFIRVGSSSSDIQITYFG